MSNPDKPYEMAENDRINTGMSEMEQLQNDLITHLDGYPEDLIALLCDVVAEYY